MQATKGQKPTPSSVERRVVVANALNKSEEQMNKNTKMRKPSLSSFVRRELIAKAEGATEGDQIEASRRHMRNGRKARMKSSDDEISKSSWSQLSLSSHTPSSRKFDTTKTRSVVPQDDDSWVI